MGCSNAKVQAVTPDSNTKLQAVMPESPELWGLTVQQLYDFACEVYETDDLLPFLAPSLLGGQEDYSDDPPLSMYDVVKRHVKPKTAGSNVSLAVLLNRDAPKRASVFVSHSWAEDFAYFVYVVCRGLLGEFNIGANKMTPERDGRMLGFGSARVLDPNTVIWCCALAINQNADI